MCHNQRCYFNWRSNIHAAPLLRDVEAGEEAEEAMEVSEDPAETEGQEAQETTQAVGVSFAAVPKHFLLHDPAGTTIC